MIVTILKKDLKRKKAMNIILLIFMILAATFISSSIFNILAITNSLDNFFTQSKVADFMFLSGSEELESSTTFLENSEVIDNWNQSKAYLLEGDSITTDDSENISIGTFIWLTTTEFNNQIIFDKENKPLSNLPQGEVYLTHKFLSVHELEIGDFINIKMGDNSKDFLVSGIYKDAYFGSPLMGGADRIVISQDDYKFLLEDTNPNYQLLYTVNTNNLTELLDTFKKSPINVIFSAEKALLENTYILEIIIAFALLMVSLCLVCISFVIIRFSIKFTLSEDFRDIGIMKAIGITNFYIRWIYMIKYLCISLIGCFLGFLLGIPASNFLLAQTSKTMILQISNLGFIVSGFCIILLIFMVLLFCYTTTKFVVKISPIAAISYGTSGERFKRKSFLSLAHWNFRPFSFLAINDIVSSPKRFLSLISIFILGTILISIPTNTANTLGHKELMGSMGYLSSDLHVMMNTADILKTSNLNDYIREESDKLEDSCKNNDNMATISSTYTFTTKSSFQDNSVKHVLFQHQNHIFEADDYLEGLPPNAIDEVAITKLTAKELGCEIGDTISISLGDTEKEFLITAYFQTMQSMGQGIRIHSDIDINNTPPMSLFFHLNLSQPTNLLETQQVLQDALPDYTVYSYEETINLLTGNTKKTLEQLSTLIFIIIVFINILVTVLIATSFILKETGEISMLKALGFSNFTLRKWQTMRIGFILIFAITVGSLLSFPVTQITSGQVFKMMGLESVTFAADYTKIYLLYPFILITTTTLATFITSRLIIKVKTSEINTID